jgi:Flp pilus assembly protein TadG
MKRNRSAESGSEEQGTFSILFSIVLGTGLLLIIVTIVLDGGQILAERRVLKNVAESSALALAAECLTNLPACKSSTTPKELASENSPDGKTSITEICIQGKDVLRNNSDCRPVSSSSIDCTFTPKETSNYVRIRTQSLTKNGSSLLKSLFGGGQGYEVNACAQAVWGAAISAKTFAPIALSVCDRDLVLSGARIAERIPSSKLKVVSCDYQTTTTPPKTIVLWGVGREVNPSWVAIDLQSASLQDRKATSLCPDLNSQTGATLKVNDVLDQLNASGNSSAICPDSKLGERMCGWLGQQLTIPLVSTPGPYPGNQVTGSPKFRVEAFTQMKLIAFSINDGNGGNRACTGNGGNNGGANGTTPTWGGNPPIGNSNWCNGSGNRICIYGEFSTSLSPDSDLGTGNSNPDIGVRAIKLI